MSPAQGNPWPYQYAVVALDRCFVDDAYQRPTLPAFIQAIADDLQPELIGTLRGNVRRNDKIALIDGQQRWSALKICDFETAPVLLSTGLTIAQEASLFASLNFWRKNAQPWYHYRALRVARDSLVCAIDDLVEAQAYRVGHSAAPEDMIGSPDTLIAIYRGDTDVVRSPALEGPEVLARTLEAISAWRGTTVTWQQGKTGSMLRGVARWISVNPNVPAHALGLALRTIEPSMVHQQAKELQAGGSGSGKGRKVETVIERVYKRHGEQSYRRASEGAA
jgi:hypothetical protein